MITAGIDLASQDDNTAVCVINWDPPDGDDHFQCWRRSGWTDDKLIELMEDNSIDRIAIDGPFGWPTDYVDAISAFRDNGTWPARGSHKDFGRYRSTESHLEESTGVRALSASLGDFAWVARRCARLLARQPRGETPEISRLAEGFLVETYPAASLKCWGISPAYSKTDPGGYKGNKPPAVARRRRLAQELASELVSAVRLPNDFVDRSAGSGGDDLIDAVIAALVARTMELDRCEPIPGGKRGKARLEGWIRLPKETRLSESVADLTVA